jgi:hypothetical protein
MADFDKECGCGTITSPLEASDTKHGCMPGWDDFLGAYNKKIAEEDKNKWVHGMCNPKAK